MKYLEIKTPVKKEEVTLIEKAFMNAGKIKHKKKQVKLDVSKLTHEQRMIRGCG